MEGSEFWFKLGVLSLRWGSWSEILRCVFCLILRGTSVGSKILVAWSGVGCAICGRVLLLAVPNDNPAVNGPCVQSNLSAVSSSPRSLLTCSGEFNEMSCCCTTGSVEGLLDSENALTVCASLGVGGLPNDPKSCLILPVSLVTTGLLLPDAAVSVLYGSSVLPVPSVVLVLVWCPGAACDTGGVAN